MNSATISQVICAVHVEVATFFHERPLTAGVLARCVEARRFSRVEEKRWLDAVHPLPLDYYARASPLGGGSSSHGASQSGSQTIATGSMSAPTLSPNNPPLYVALRHLTRGVYWGGLSCDPKGSTAFLQNKFQCPPMVGVYRTYRT
jgi:hypothetical protein